MNGQLSRTLDAERMPLVPPIPVAPPIPVVPPMFSIELAWAASPSVKSRKKRGARYHERRHGGRVASSGTAVVRAGALSMRARIVDLAAGGICVLADTTAASSLLVGTHVQLDIRVDGVGGGWLHLLGRIERVDARALASAIVIELDAVPPDFEDLVQDELLAALECAQTPHVLVVDADRCRRDLVASAFRDTGCHVIEATSPLEAIIALDESKLHPWAVVIAETDFDLRADELRSFLREAYPCLPLIAIGERGRTRSTTCLSVDRIPDLALQVHDLVRG